MYVQLTIQVHGLKTQKEGVDFCYNLAEHITKTYNDDDSIESISYTVPAKGKKNTKDIVHALRASLSKSLELLRYYEPETFLDEEGAKSYRDTMTAAQLTLERTKD